MKTKTKTPKSIKQFQPKKGPAINGKRLLDRLRKRIQVQYNTIQIKEEEIKQLKTQVQGLNMDCNFLRNKLNEQQQTES